MSASRSMLFVSPRFLFPLDSGGRIRTTEILRNLKGGGYKITLASPATPGEISAHGRDLEAVCDRFVSWPGLRPGPWARLRRAASVLARLPLSVQMDRSERGRTLVRREIEARPDVVVADFAHAAVLVDAPLAVPSVLFTHNVESEILERHAAVAGNPLLRMLWAQQHRKMLAFERNALARFDQVIAVSKRDAAKFVAEFGLAHCSDIPTGVDADYFSYIGPAQSKSVAFIGSMDSPANVDGIGFLIDEIWPKLTALVPDAKMSVIGRSPPPRLVQRARTLGLNWQFTGRVDDIRPHVAGAAVAVIPLRVGGGTRIKAFEAMAMGIPLVSTSLGVEGLGLTAGLHFLEADAANDIAVALAKVIGDGDLRARLARVGREHVVATASNRTVAQRFAEICDLAIERRRGRASVPFRAGADAQRSRATDPLAH